MTGKQEVETVTGRSWNSLSSLPTIRVKSAGLASPRVGRYTSDESIRKHWRLPWDGTAFDMLSRFIDHEYVDPQDMWMRGMAASLGIAKGKPFTPDGSMRAMLDRAARVAFGMSRAVAFTRMDGPNGIRTGDG